MIVKMKEMKKIQFGLGSNFTKAFCLIEVITECVCVATSASRVEMMCSGA